VSTPERQQDPGEHGYGGVQQDKEEARQEDPLDDPQADPRQPNDEGDAKRQVDEDVEG
jgi:hypothetical protein